jgi:hypothetical protein
MTLERMEIVTPGCLISHAGFTVDCSTYPYVIISRVSSGKPSLTLNSRAAHLYMIWASEEKNFIKWRQE